MRNHLWNGTGVHRRSVQLRCGHDDDRGRLCRDVFRPEQLRYRRQSLCDERVVYCRCLRLPPWIHDGWYSVCRSTDRPEQLWRAGDSLHRRDARLRRRHLPGRGSLRWRCQSGVQRRLCRHRHRSAELRRMRAALRSQSGLFGRHVSGLRRDGCLYDVSVCRLRRNDVLPESGWRRTTHLCGRRLSPGSVAMGGSTAIHVHERSGRISAGRGDCLPSKQSSMVDAVVIRPRMCQYRNASLRAAARWQALDR